MIHLQVDGRPVEAVEGQAVLTAALDAGIYVPHLCAHPDLSSDGGCRLCMVEIDGFARPVQACEIPVAEGMVVRTSTPAVEHIRTVALELVLAPHPKDCTSCAAYLNCELQALMQYAGVAHSRLREIDKRTATVGTSDSIVRREMFRCIQCTRCIRACDELRGVGVLELRHADGEVYVGTKDDVPFSRTDCRYCSACVEVCPTGALMDVPGLFAADVPRNDAVVPCQNSCPAHTDIPLYLRLAGEGRYADSVSVFREKLTFPLSLGYVCNHVCESDCKRGKLDQPLSIREIKRFAVENDAERTWRDRVTVAEPTRRRAAVVGGGPTGLTAAWYLARKGHDVTVLERMPRPGGMLSYGIPRYRLPQEVVDGEIATLLELAPFRIETGTNVDDPRKLLERGFDAVLLAVGAQAGRRPTEFAGPWPNAYDGVDLCRGWNDGTAPALGDVVSVFGGGNVAFDCAQSAKRAGARVVRVMCLESADAMLADPEELEAARAEGIDVLNSVSLREVHVVDGRVTGLGMVRVRSFSFGATGLQLELEPDGAFDLPTEALIFATGQQPDLGPAPGVELSRGGLVVTSAGSATSTQGVFAAGDVVTGTRTVVSAVAAGRLAATDIDRFLGGDGDIEDIFFEREPHDGRIGAVEGFATMTRTACDSAASVSAEALRCLRCELRRDIALVKYWTDPAFRAGEKVGRKVEA